MTTLALIVLLLKVTGFLLIALLATLALQRKSAGTRHLVWLVALAALLIVPALAVWSPLPLPVLPTEFVADVTPIAPVVNRQATDAAVGNLPTEPAVQGSATPVTPENTAPVSTKPSLTVVLFTVWATVAAILLLRLLYGAWSVRRIVRRGQLLEHPDWQVPLYEIADRLELNEAPVLLRSEDVKMPFASGLFRSTIVLPAESDGWSAERRSAVLIHELGHIRRRDLIGHTLGRIACALYWFHPLVWTAARQLRAESERACDDLALVFGAKPSDYAEHLLDIVTCVRNHYTPSVALAMAHRKEFEGRMLAILNPDLMRRGLGRMETVFLAGSLAVLAVIIGAAAPVASNATVAERVEQRESQPLRMQDTGATEQLATAPIAKPAPTPKPEPTAKPAPVSTPVSTRLSQEQADSVKDERADALAKTLRTDTDAEIRRVAAWGLSNYADTDVGESALVYAVTNDSDARVREMAAWALADARPRESASAAIGKAMTDKDPMVRKTAVWAAGSLGDEGAISGLVSALADPDANTRSTAAWAIGSIEPSKAPAALVALLKDSDRDVRKTAAWGLYSIEDESTADALLVAYEKEQDVDVQKAMLRAMAAMGDKAVPVLQKLLTSPDPKVRQMAVTGLAGGHASGPWPQPRPRPRPFP